MKVLIGGTFNEHGGSPSYLVSQLAETLGQEWLCLNGGYVHFIRNFVPTNIDVMIWMPNVSNDELKLVNRFKQDNPDLCLIQSKRAIEKEYTVSDVIGRLHDSQSAFGIMITKPDGKFKFNLISADGKVNMMTDSICDIGRAIEMYV